MPEKHVLLNDLYPELDEDINGPFYDKETEETGVVYRILNIMNGKSYIGKAFSCKTIVNCYGNTKLTKYGAKGRFKSHWMCANGNSKKSKNDCPIFYKALRNSNLNDWFVFILKVCLKKDLKEWETKLIKEFETYDPKYGYNIFIGNGIPCYCLYLEEYQHKKAESNTRRAINGSMKRTDTNKQLPTYISYYCTKNDGKLVNEGFLVQIKINKILYVKRFLSMKETMKEKLDKAKKQIEIFKKEAKNNNTEPKPKRNKTLPKNISYTADKNGAGNFVEGYLVRIKINGKQYQKKFLSMSETMKTKLKKAKKQVELFKKQANKINSGSKTANKKISDQ